MAMKSRLRVHYEAQLRQDLCNKLNYSNIMEVPRLSHIILLSQVPHQHISLAMETICGQQGAQRMRVAPIASKSRVRGHKARSGPVSKPLEILRTCVRGDLMYHLLEKWITQFALYGLGESQIQNHCVQLTIGSNLLRLLPEIQDYFEIFEKAQSLQMILVTSAKSEEETRLLWTGLLQT